MIQYTGTKINITRFYLVLDIQLVFCFRRELDLYRNYIHLHFAALIMQTCVIFSINYFNLNVSPCYLTTLREGNLIVHPWNQLLPTALKNKRPLLVKAFRIGKNLPLSCAGPRTGG
jgi:hypothetical protein